MIHFKHWLSLVDFQKGNFHLHIFLIFCVTFSDIKSLLSRSNSFINDIDNNIQWLKPNFILQITYGFYDVGAKWQFAGDATYVDIY